MSAITYQELLVKVLPRPEPLVEGLVAAGDKIFCYAEEKVGKTLLCYQLALALASGKDFVGFRVPKPRPVLFIAAESPLWQLKLYQSAMSGFRLEQDLITFLYQPLPKLNKSKGQTMLREEAEKMRDRVGEYPALTVVDPVAYLLDGSMKEDEDVRSFQDTLNQYEALTGSAVWVNSHPHKDRRDEGGHLIDEGEKGAYFGSRAWAWWYSTGFVLKRLPNGNRMLKLMDEGRIPQYLALRKDDEIELILSQKPLAYVPATEHITYATQYALVEELTATTHTAAELESLSGRSHRAVFEALRTLRASGLIQGDNGHPESFHLVREKYAAEKPLWLIRRASRVSDDV